MTRNMPNLNCTVKSICMDDGVYLMGVCIILSPINSMDKWTLRYLMSVALSLFVSSKHFESYFYLITLANYMFLEVIYISS